MSAVQSADCCAEDKSEESKTILSTHWLCNLTTDETGRLQHFLFLLFFTPQISKGVDNDTKDQIEDNNDDHEEEQQVINYSGSEQRLLKSEENTVKGKQMKYQDFFSINWSNYKLSLDWFCFYFFVGLSTMLSTFMEHVFFFFLEELI